MKSFFIYWLPLGAYACLIFYLSSIQKPPSPPFFDFPHADKLTHFLEYMILGMLLVRTYPAWGGRVCYNELLYISAALVSFYGLTDEIHQMFVPMRQCSVGDWLADTGGGIAAALFLFFKKTQSLRDA